jgi:hypothetical protein
METHVKVLGVLYMAVSALFALAGLFFMMTMGALAGVAGMSGDPDAAVAVPFFGFLGAGLGMFLLLVSVPGVITGWGLLNYKPWARIVGIVLSALNLLNIPFGTILGIYGLWVLLNKQTERLFSPNLPPTTV